MTKQSHEFPVNISLTEREYEESENESLRFLEIE